MTTMIVRIVITLIAVGATGLSGLMLLSVATHDNNPPIALWLAPVCLGLIFAGLLVALWAAVAAAWRA